MHVKRRLPLADAHLRAAELHDDVLPARDRVDVRAPRPNVVVAGVRVDASAAEMVER